MCRLDKAPTISSYASQCHKDRCTAGVVQNDINTFLSLYNSYCAEAGYTLPGYSAAAAEPTVGGSGGGGGGGGGGTTATRTTFVSPTSGLSSGTSGTATEGGRGKWFALGTAAAVSLFVTSVGMA